MPLLSSTGTKVIQTDKPYIMLQSYRLIKVYKNIKTILQKNSLDAGIQDESTSISIVVKVDLWLMKKKKKKKKLMKVTNIYKHEIVDTRA